jgi:hypothetical protein
MAEDINPELLQQLLTLNEDEVIVPLRVMRADVSKIKAVKLSDQEVATVQNFQDYLFDQKYILDNHFASMFVYLFNLGYTLHKKVVDEVEKREKEAQPA